MSATAIAAALPAQAGLGLRAPHVKTVLEQRPAVAWWEVHSENYFAAGGPALAALASLRADHPVSLHGVGMSLGSPDGLDPQHMGKLRELMRRIEPAAVSEHLCWSHLGGAHFNDLLPLPYTREALDVVCANVARLQDFLGRSILVENVSSYLRFKQEDMPESDFLAELARRTGCGLLLDVNNVYVSAVNHGFDAHAFIDGIPSEAVVEIHLAGYEEVDGLLIDTHSRPVYQAVWELYEYALARFGKVPTLIEWDQDVPSLDVLMDQARQAQMRLDRQTGKHHDLAA